MPLNIGILAIQGAFAEHKECLVKAAKLVKPKNVKDSFDLAVTEVRAASDVNNLDGLIIPGGESTAMGKSLDRYGFKDVIKSWMNKDVKPVVWGTCAGMILLANDIEGVKDGGQSNLGGLDVTVSRNYFGRQINSFEAPVDMKLEDMHLKSENLLDETYHGVFIRAPAVCSCNSNKVQILGTVESSRKPGSSVIVAVRQDNIIATAFHPELTEDIRWHKYFLKLVISNKTSTLEAPMDGES